jgi:hypothetical protein
MVEEPGLDEYDWQSEYASFEEDLEDDPAATLPQLADLLERMLGERGYDLDDPVVREGEERGIVADYLAARETSDRVERGENVDPGDIGAAIVNLHELFEVLVAERSPP